MQISKLQKQNQVDRLEETVIKGGYCVGCGACASLNESPFKIELDRYGKYTAVLESQPTKPQSNLSVLEVCPFSEKAKNEDEIAQELFAQNCDYHNRIGYYQNTYAGFVVENSFRERGSSGGLGSWILTKLFEQNLIDAVVHVKQNNSRQQNDLLFSFQISHSIDEISQGAKSRYYPVEMSEVIKTIRNRDGRYAIVGVPCFTKAIRLLMYEDSILKKRIKFCISLVCGHLKSTKFADMFAWQYGISPGNLSSIDFRQKIPGANANKYGIKVKGRDKEGNKIEDTRQNKDLYGSLWGHGFFKYQACDYCDDVLGETADITIGDAWLPQYIRDSAGTNVVVVRNKIISELIEKGILEKRLQLERISPDEVAKSQDAGLRHRREGLSYRLYLKDKDNAWRPKKRVEAKSYVSDTNFRKIHEMRVALAQQSHCAFEKAVQSDSFDKFREIMQPLLEQYNRISSEQYNRIYKAPFWKRIVFRLQKILFK